MLDRNCLAVYEDEVGPTSVVLAEKTSDKLAAMKTGALQGTQFRVDIFSSRLRRVRDVQSALIASN